LQNLRQAGLLVTSGITAFQSDLHFTVSVFNHIPSSSNTAGKTLRVGDKHSTWTVLIAGLHMMYACVPRTVTYYSVLKHTFEQSFRCIPRVVCGLCALCVVCGLCKKDYI